MGKFLGPVAKRLLKWLLKHGQEELDKELEKRRVVTEPSIRTR